MGAPDPQVRALELHHDPPDHSPLHGGYTHAGNVGADPEVVDHFTALAGDGTVDERCARILAAYRDVWFGDPNDQEHEP